MEPGTRIGHSRVLVNCSPAGTTRSPQSLGVYVHFPYCLQKCPYCDFLSVPIERPRIPQARYSRAVLNELAARRPELPDLPIHSIFFGGGTPSLWDPSELARVLEALLGSFRHDPKTLEITAECNPSSFDLRVAQGFRSAGVNRISLGVQGLEQERLRFLGRLHDAGSAFAALALAVKHFPNVSADLIFGVDRQSPDVAAAEVEAVVQSGVSHVSAYALTVEPGTQFGELQRRGRLPLLADELVAESFERVERSLEARGFEHYEISNYARPNHRSRHNLGYWRGEPYLGLGAGAFGTLPRATPLTGSAPAELASAVRYRNTPAIERYLTWAERESGDVDLWCEGSPWVASCEPLSRQTQLQERILLGLRLRDGLDVEVAEAETGAPFWTEARKKAVARWVDRGALLSEGTRLRLHPSRFLIADRVLVDLL